MRWAQKALQKTLRVVLLGPLLPFLWPIHSVAGETQPLPALFPGPLARLLQWAQDALHPPLTGR